MDYNLSAKKSKEEVTTYLHARFPTMLMARKYQRQYHNCSSICQWKNKVVRGCIPAGGWISVKFFDAIGCNMALFCYVGLLKLVSWHDDIEDHVQMVKSKSRWNWKVGLELGSEI
ncbi:unnamed protein product [Lathyrus oleraceus]|uniref:uncharacterized protein LOC127129060 isoform X1 n=1 Tax=Pisum sativum TaxID=3888 RepID=UPI0021D19E8A|nr:uncharacterized protein LOC127129060 isoform X1 [Pisum sativum]